MTYYNILFLLTPAQVCLVGADGALCIGWCVAVFQLGGIVKPNDGHCHLDGAGYYSESLNQVSLADNFYLLD